MNSKRIISWLMISLLSTLIFTDRAGASGEEPISQSDLSISIDTSMSEAVSETEIETEKGKYDYDPNWTITLNAFDVAMKISEMDYSIIADGGTESYAISLDRLGMTAERALEILHTNRAMMEVFPATAGEYTDYIIYFFDDGKYKDAEEKNLDQLIEEKSPVVDLFREDCRDHIFTEDKCLNRSCEEEVAFGPYLCDVYTYSFDNGTYFMDYATVHNGSLLVIEGAYWEEQYAGTVKAAIESIMQNAMPVVHNFVPAFDPEDLKQSLWDQNALQLADMTGMASFNIIRYFPFGTKKDEIRNELEANHTVYEDNGSGTNEFYVFYKIGLDEQWQCFYEFDGEDSLVSVTLVFIAEGTSDVFADAFLDALDYFTERTGDYETDQQADIDLLREDSDAFMEKLDAGEASVMAGWQDAFGKEGEDLYLNFRKIEENSAVFLTFFADGYQH